MPDRMSEDMPDRMSEDMPDRMSEEMTDRMSEDMPDRRENRGTTQVKSRWIPGHQNQQAAAYFATWANVSAKATRFT